MKSIGLFLLSVKYIQQRRFLPYLLFNDAGFHVPFQHSCSCSRCILCPGHCPGSVSSSYLSSAISFTFRRSLTWPLISEGGRFLGGKYAALTGAYLNSDLYAQARGISIGYLERTLTFVLVVLFIKLNTREHAVFLEHVLVLFINLWMSWEITILVDRIGLFVFTPYLVLWPAVARCFYIKNRTGCCSSGGIMIYSLIGYRSVRTMALSIRQCPSDEISILMANTTRSHLINKINQV